MEVTLTNLSKSYRGLPVLRDLNLKLCSGNTYVLMGPSGSGKTTLIRILLGLEVPDGGIAEGLENHRMAAVFQEDRLCEEFSPVDNVWMAAGQTLSKQAAALELCKLLPGESITGKVSTLSGGMKRRVAICRALLAPSEAVLMDEPFNGLDQSTKSRVIDYIKERSQGKLLLFSTHQPEDIRLMGGTLISLG